MRNFKIILILLLLGTASAISQQVTFEFSLHLKDKNLYCMDILESTDNNIFFVGKSSNINSNKTNGYIIKLNNYGQLVDTTTIPLEYRSLRFTQAIEDSDNSIIVNGISSDTTLEKYNSSIELFRFDSQLNIINQNSIHVSDNHSLSSYLNKMSNGNFIITGSRFMGTTPPPDTRLNYLIKSNLDSAYSFQSTFAGTGGFYTKKINDSSFWMLISQKRFILTDTLFRRTGEMSQLPYNITEDYWVKWDSDSSFFLIGDFINESGNHEIGMLRMLHPMDTSGHVFKTINVNDTIVFPAPFGIDFNNKDSVFFGGTKNFWVFPNSSPSYYVLRQTDSLLNTRWEKFYGGDANYTLWTVFATKDGGCLLGGIRHDFSYPDTQTDAHVLKVNSQGLITSTTENSGIKMHEAIVFPNPGTNKFNIRVAAQHPESTVELYNINGEIILKNEIIGKRATIETSFLENGTYIYKIFNKNGLFETGKWIKN